jgi:hypothetical protein
MTSRAEWGDWPRPRRVALGVPLDRRFDGSESDLDSFVQGNRTYFNPCWGQNRDTDRENRPTEGTEA